MSVFRDDLFAGRTSFVTGGGSGICMGIAEALMRHGCNAVITSRKQIRLDEASATLESATGARCLGIAADVRDPSTIEAALDRGIEVFGGIDIVVNGAAGNFLAPAATLSYNAFRTVIEIDAVGTFNVCRAAYDKWLRDHGGSILNVSATLHYRGTALQAHPGAAKAAIDALTRHLAVEWGPAGVRVNAIAPGPIADTEGMRRLAPGPVREKLARAVPLGRLGAVDDVAQAAVFLSSSRPEMKIY